MPRGRKRRVGNSGPRKNSSALPAKRGRKPIFTGEQKRVLERLIRESLKEQLRGLVKSL
jgi:hypothetical protein